MERKPSLSQSTRYIKLLSVLFVALLFNACTNDFEYLSTHKPAWLGESIYEQLEQGYTDDKGTKHEFATFIRLINDIEYDEVLRKTGSKTLFVADDKAFERFYASNPWGVKSYEGFTIAQKKLILNSSMINNAYLVELMSNTVGPVEGQALRRTTAISTLDSIPFEKPDALPKNSNWDRFRDKGLYLQKDATAIPMLHFLQRQMDFKGISNDDFTALFNGRQREKNDAHIFGVKIIARDITCKNGYINILEEVMIPPANMAELIRISPETQEFSAILERFSAPYYSATATRAYKDINPSFTDSIFVKSYFAERSILGLPNLLNPKGQAQPGYLEFDPGWNTYTLGTSMQVDMGAIFVPTNQAIQNFFFNGGGKFLIEKYKTIDSIPNDVLDDLLRNHMKPSFNGTVPSKFGEILDDGKESMGISKGDLVKSYVANNGVVYVTNKIYAPASYVAVTAPVMINDYTKIFNWGVKSRQFDAYLLSMDSHYSFIVPYDRPDLFSNNGNGFMYVDPVSIAKAQPEVLKFKFKAPNAVEAVVYKYNIETNEVGDSIRKATAAEINNRMDDMLDYHIVVGDIEDGKLYYRTKGGGQIKVGKNGHLNTLMGGGNIEADKFSQIHKVYDQTKATNGRGNGKTYLVDSPLLPPYRSVYSILKNGEEFSEFFKLLQGDDQANPAAGNKYDIFYSDKKYVGMDYNVKFFNTYHYSVYVPTNEAVESAIAKGLPTWEIIKAETDQQLKDSMTILLNNFLKYHFQDNSLYVDGATTKNNEYETAAYTLTGNKAYYKLHTELTPSGLVLKTAANTTARVKTDGKYNIMARDYKFNNPDREKATLIETSSWAVIHQIDNVLLYDSQVLRKMKQLTDRSKAKRKQVITKRTVK